MALRRWALIILSVTILVLGQLSAATDEDAAGRATPGGRTPPVFPTRFTATVEVTAHLVDRTKDYPPWLRVIEVAYDYEAKKVKAVVEQGYDEGKTFLRRYDNRSEFMVRGGQYPECQRAYLGEDMPPPRLPASLAFVSGDEVIDSQACEHWVDDLGTNRVHVWACPAIDGGASGESSSGVEIVEASSSGVLWPRRVLDEQVDPGGVSVPLMTYDFTQLRVNAAAATRLDATDTFDVPPPYGWRSCARNIGGFPYLHVFHHYVRF